MKSTQTLLITGATAGIGRRAALHLAARGLHVIATGRNQAALAELAREAPAGARLDTLALDVTDPASIGAAVAAVDRLTAGRGLDVLVNNAGFGVAAAVEQTTDADVRAQFETNVFGLLAMVRAFAPAMRARGRGRIINVSSVGGRVTLPFYGVYNSTKYAVESLSDALRLELKPFGIDVVLVEPGAIRTNFAGRSLVDAGAYGDARSPYAAAYARYVELVRRTDAGAPGPEVIARALHRAATARRPRARYVAPFVNRLVLLMLALLPTRLVDWSMRQIVGLTPRRLAARSLAALAVIAALLAPARPARAEATHTIKIATLAPDGTLWMKLFQDWARDVERDTSGSLKIKFYSGGVAGDERDLVRKMRLGQLSGAAVTSIGLGLIQPEVRVLEVPMLIRSWDELDHVRAALDGELRAKFAEKGFVLLGWGDVGPIYLFSKIPIRAPADLDKVKLWAWSDDPISRALVAHLHVTGVPLGAPDVLPALSTGMVDAAFGTPLAVLALQWYTKVTHVTSMRFGQAIGATVIAKAQFDKLTAAEQKALLDDARKMESALQAQIRAENERALASLQRAGLVVDASPPGMEKELAAVALPLRDELEPQLDSHAQRLRVEKMVADSRATKLAKH